MLSYKDSLARVAPAFNAGILNGHTMADKLEPYFASLLDFMDFHGIESFSELFFMEKNRLDDMIIAYFDEIDRRLICRRCRLVWNEGAEMFTYSTVFYKAMEYFCALHHKERPFWDYIRAKTNLEFIWYNAKSGEVLGYHLDRSEKPKL